MTEMHIMMSIFLFVMGVCIGSFLNVCIYRIPRKEPLIFSRSHCTKCGTKLRAVDNIPLLSFIFLGGKCRTCKSNISMQYPIVELLTGLIFLLSYRYFGWGLEFVSKVVFLSMLIVISFVDLEHRMIPDIISLSGMILGLGFSFLLKSITFWESLLGFLIGGVLLYLVALLGDLLFKKESMGGGDIKMAAMIGAFLGWQRLLAALFIAVALGAFVGVVSMLTSSRVRKDKIIPFGPFLALGAAICVFWGERLIEIYVRNFLP